tara:strand:+ start:28 stop:852 length:825 start_codon:yes stop_codon:yes gene_type:complete
MKKLKKNLVTIILTFNSEKILNKNITSCKKLKGDILIIDSFSNDKTIKIAKKHNCKIIKRKFKNYSDQRNFAIKHANKFYEWQLHLDSDEILSKKSIDFINKFNITHEKKKFSYIIKRKVFFLDKEIKFGLSSSYHLRFFPSNSTIVSKDKYDQHFISKLESRKIPGYMNDYQDKDLDEWIALHNRWSNLAIDDEENWGKNKNNHKTFYIAHRTTTKKLLLKLPFNLGPILIFLIRYFLFLGFLDGKIGFYYIFMQSLWFRTLIKAKIYEKNLK